MKDKKRLNQSDYQLILDLLEKEIRDKKDFLATGNEVDPTNTEWGLSPQERGGVRAYLQQCQAIYKLLCPRAYPVASYCDQPEKRRLWESEKA